MCISLPALHDPRGNSYFHVLWRARISDDKFFFPFLNLDVVFRNSTPGEFAYIWQDQVSEYVTCNKSAFKGVKSSLKEKKWGGDLFFTKHRRPRRSVSITWTKWDNPSSLPWTKSRDFVWEIYYWDLRTPNNAKPYFFEMKWIKKAYLQCIPLNFGVCRFTGFLALSRYHCYSLRERRG